MGSPKDEIERMADREQQHLVTLTRGYWLADTACTQALWIAVTGINPSRFQESLNLPVETVSWDDVKQFIRRLNAQETGLNARLPTEAEWEYACRAGTSTPFSFGTRITPNQVNFNGNYPYAGAKKARYREKTVPVKSLPANLWGLYEMHGNVWEWCADWLDIYHANETVDPKGPNSGVSRVLRGGSWHSHARRTRSTYRYWTTPDARLQNIGFRLALG